MLINNLPIRITVALSDVVLPASLDATHLYLSDSITFLTTRVSPLVKDKSSHCSLLVELISHLYIISFSLVALQLRVVPTLAFTTLLVGWVVIVGGPMNNNCYNAIASIYILLC